METGVDPTVHRPVPACWHAIFFMVKAFCYFIICSHKKKEKRKKGKRQVIHHNSPDICP